MPKLSKPRYRLIAALSLDGYLARDHHHLTDWTSPEDKEFLHTLLDEGDIIVVGNTTYELARKPLSRRACLVFSRKARKVSNGQKFCRYFNPQKVSLPKFINGNNYRLINVLGGRQVYSWFLRQGLMDDIYLTIEPVIFGAGLSLFNVKLKKILKNFKLASVRRLNQTGTVLLHYIRNNN